jgi:hypothetical protein
MFNGLLPPDVTAAMNEMFNRNNDVAEVMDNTPTSMVREGIDELLEVVVHEAI